MDFTTYIGVDLGGGKGKNTAVAVLRRNGEQGVVVTFAAVKSEQGKPFYDSELVPLLKEQAEGAVLSIDAPLTPTVCMRCSLPRCPGMRRCVDPTVGWFREVGNSLVGRKSRRSRKPPTTPYTQRACEVILHKCYGILPRETLGQGMGPLTARASYLRRVLADRYQINRNLLEVYPKATIHALVSADAARCYKRETRTWQVRAMILEQLSQELTFNVWRERVLKIDHIFDAVVAAYTAYLWDKESWQMPEEHREVLEEDGWIWFPPMQEKT